MGVTLKATTAVLLVLAGLASAPATAGSDQQTRLPIAIADMPAGTTVTVEPGDHLWKISESQLEQRLGTKVPDEVVSDYWRRLIELNREDLRSGDPDLIYPGETIRLPPPTVSEQP